VNYIRTTPEFGSNTFEIGTFSRKFVFRADTEEQAKQWLLGMHCSIAQAHSTHPPPHPMHRARAPPRTGSRGGRACGMYDAQIVGDMVSPQNKLNRQRLAKVPKWWKHGRHHTALAPPPSAAAAYDDPVLLDETAPTHIPIHTSLHQAPPPHPPPHTTHTPPAHMLAFLARIFPAQRTAGELRLEAVLGFTRGQVIPQSPFIVLYMKYID
jgi:hypothetical protein